MTDAPGPLPLRPTRENSRTIPATCRNHGARGFCNLRVTREDGNIVLYPHIADCCVIELDETEVTALRDLVTEWLG